MSLKALKGTFSNEVSLWLALVMQTQSHNPLALASISCLGYLFHAAINSAIIDLQDTLQDKFRGLCQVVSPLVSVVNKLW